MYVYLLLFKKDFFTYKKNFKLSNNLYFLKKERIWAESDLNQRRRAPADLQSAPVDHFGIGPSKKGEL